jgi:hypothetical protein
MMDTVKTKTATLIRKYGKGKAWDRAGLYGLSPPMPQVLRDGSHEQIEYVLVAVQGDTALMLASDKDGLLAAPYARWLPMTRDDGEWRGVSVVENPSCAAALEAEGYEITDWGGTR